MTPLLSTLRCLLLSSALLALGACAAKPDRERVEQGSSGPTIYGQVSASLDHVSTR